MKISNMIDAGELIEDNDWTSLDNALRPCPDDIDLPRVSMHQHGYIMFVDGTYLIEEVESLVDNGFSDEVVRIYEEAVDNDCILINFDVG